MKNNLLFLGCIIAVALHTGQAQIAITDSFSDGNFTANPAWIGDTSHFQISAGQLQLNRPNPQTDTSVLALSSPIADSARWRFQFRFTQNLTSSNYARIYLLSDKPQLRQPLRGYFIEMSASSADELKLIRQDGLQENVLIRSANGYLGGSLINVRVEVTRDKNQQWTLRADTGTVINPLQTIGTAVDSTHRISRYFGLFCRYTTTRADQFFFDNFNLTGLPFQDNIAPELTGLSATHADSLQLQFNEPLDSLSAVTLAHYSVGRGVGPPIAARHAPGSQRVQLHFATTWQSGLSYPLSLSNVRDTAGNALSALDTFTVSAQPPHLQRVNITDSLTLQVFFNKDVSSTTAGNAANFQLVPGITIASANVQSARTTELQLATPLPPQGNFELIARQIEDDFGFVMNDTLNFNAGQLQIFEDFSDGNFTANPPWQGDTADYVVNTREQLQLQAATVAPRYLSTPSPIMQDASWQMDVKLDFNPSSQNLAKVYLASEDSVLTGAVNGYYLLIGGSDDEVSLFRQDGTSERALIRSAANLVDVDPVEITCRVTRSAQARWQLWVRSAPGAPFVSMGSAVDSTYRSSLYFGLRSEFSSTRADKMFFDNIQITGLPFTDKVPPRLDSLQVLSDTALRLVFSESLTRATAQNSALYSLSPVIGNPAAARQDSSRPAQVTLFLSSPLQNRTSYTLSVNGLSDRFGNAASLSRTFTFLRARPGDVVINELMPDPNPVVGLPPQVLPEREYLELYNASGVDINLQGFFLQAGSSEATLPAYRLPADSLLVLVAEGTEGDFADSLPLLPVDISATALLNGGTTVSLFSPEGGLINTVSYQSAWYDNADKRSGGWSLERIDPGNFCGSGNNWRGSESPLGGTPGAENSVRAPNPDTVAPALQQIRLLNDRQVSLLLSEFTEAEVLANPATYGLEPKLTIDSVTLQQPDLLRVNLHFAQAISPGVIYKIWLQNPPSDCAGNHLLPDTLRFALPEIPDSGDVVINEILFNPASGGSDFVELYNLSDKVLDLRNLRLANWNAQAGAPENIVELNSAGELLFPGQYVALSADIAFLEELYVIKAPENLVETANSLPSMNDDEGSIALLTSNFITLDYVQYQDDWHLSVLRDKEGVSLERLDFSAPGNDNNNWQSAAQSAGFATPGYRNSHQRLVSASRGQLSLEPRVFSPNQDGFRDLLHINYAFARANHIASVFIFNTNGVLIKEIANSVNLAREGFFTWDGTNLNGQRLGSGVYIVVVEYFNENGSQAVIKETCVLSL